MSKSITEEWRDVKGYEGIYQVSNFGSVKSLDRVIIQRKSKNGTQKRRIKGKILTPTDNGNGYKLVGLRRECNGRYVKNNHYVHRIVAESFIGHIPSGMVINHIDYNRSNNRVSNLEIVTQSENVSHSSNRMRLPKSKCKPSNTGEKYICFKGRSYIVCINRLHIYKSFKSLDSAVSYRNEVLNNV